MKQSINSYQFEQAFREMGRGDQFSYEGLNALYEYLEELEEGTGEEMELDVIALCCDFAEYETAVECIKDCGYEIELPEDPDEAEETALEYLRENTQVIEFDGGVIIQGF